MELIAGWTCKTAMWLSVTSTLISGLYIAPADARGSQQSSESAAQASTEGAQQIDQHGVAEPPEVIYKTTDAAGRVHYVVTNNGQLAGAGVPKVERQPELVPDPVPDIPAQLVYHPVPSLPPASIRKHHEGTTIVRMFFGVDGRVKDVLVTKSSGYMELDRLALGAARMWKIKPGSKDGLPLRGSITAPITFTLPKSPTTFSPARTKPKAPTDGYHLLVPPPSRLPLFGPPPAQPSGPRPDAPASIFYAPMPPTPPELVRQPHRGTTVVRIFYDDRGVPWHVSVETTNGYLARNHIDVAPFVVAAATYQRASRVLDVC
jgi:TonB family protein